MNWNLVKEYFEDDGMLIDVYYEQMTTHGWEELFNWLSTCQDVTSVNCYIPEIDENLEKIPSDVARYIEMNGFYCFVSILVGGITVFLRFYEQTELECDISPSEIENDKQLATLLNVLEKIKFITGVNRYLVCPENCKESAFILNGEFIA